MLAGFLIEPVKFFHMLGLAADVERLGCSGLHPIRQLETLDARREFIFRRRLRELRAIQPREEVELRALALVGQRREALEIVDRLALRLEPRPLVNARQKTRAPIQRAAFRQTAIERIAHHHERRQTVRHRAEPIRHPRADARIAHPRHARVHHEKRGRVVVRLRPARVDEGHLVHMLRELRKKTARPSAALPLLRKCERRFHQRADGVGEKSRLRVEARERLAVALREFGFVVPRIDLARAAVGENPNHRLRTRRKVRRLRAERIRAGRVRAFEQRSEREPAETTAGALEPLATSEEIRMWIHGA